LRPADYATARASFERAVTFLRGGDAATAEGICRNALESHPRDANLLCLLAAALVKQERATEAEAELRLAVEIIPGFAGAHEGLGEALIMQGRLEEALSSLETARAIEPQRASVQQKLGHVLAALGRGQDADTAYESSFRLTPNREALVRALELQRRGELEAAEKVYREVLLRNPDDVDAMRLLASIAMSVRQFGDAEIMLKRALELAPDFFQARMDLGLTQQEQDKLDDAGETFRRAARLEPQRAQPWTALATTLAMAGRHEEALTAYDEALAREDRNPFALTGRGHVLKTIGRQDEAIASYRRCTKLHPGHGEAHWSLANLKTFHFEDEEIDAMRRLLDSTSLREEPRVNLLFALATALEQRGDVEGAWQYFTEGNALRRQRESYDPVQTTVLHDQLIEVFNRDFLERWHGHGHPGREPILIIGLPRSGSTLIEQILASHSTVEGTHELPELSLVARSTSRQRRDRQNYPLTVRDLGGSDFFELGQAYLDRTLRHRRGAERFTDKMPNNFPHVGLVSLILPHAKIINARRHPLDSCVGCYKQLFGRGQPFTYDLYELGEYYLEYQRVMDHWHTVLPGRVLDVQYERLVSNTESEVQRLLEFCELPWEDACLAFHENPRAVRTASSEQVRRPVYASALHRWRQYEAHLGPLFEVLEPILSTLPEDLRPTIAAGMAGAAAR
jgi:tetratricopeptide (TPR) repeat protein